MCSSLYPLIGIPDHLNSTLFIPSHLSVILILTASSYLHRHFCSIMQFPHGVLITYISNSCRDCWIEMCKLLCHHVAHSIVLFNFFSSCVLLVSQQTMYVLYHFIYGMCCVCYAIAFPSLLRLLRGSPQSPPLHPQA